MELAELTARLEYISAGYADYFNISRTPDWHLLKLTEELGELTQAHLTRHGQGRDRGLDPSEQSEQLAAEIADVLAMVLLYARQAGVDVEHAIAQKWLPYEKFHRDRGFEVRQARG